MTYQEKTARIYEAMGTVVSPFYGDVDVLSGVQAITPGFSIPIHIGVVLDWINNNVPDKEEINMIFSYRPQLSQPLPLNPTEERYPVIDFITSLLDQGT